MKICMFSRISPVHSPGGMQDHVQALCAGLVRRGYAVTLITSSRADKRELEWIDGVETHFLRNAPSGRNTNAYWFGAARKLEELEPTRKFDVLHSQSVGAYGVYRTQLNRRYHLPLVTSFHGTHLDVLTTSWHTDFGAGLIGTARFFALLLNLLYRYAFRDLWFTRASDLVIATSDADVAKYKTLYGLSQSKIRKVYNGIDTDTFAPRDPGDLRARLGIPQGERILVVLARLEKDKGVQNAIEALPRICRTVPAWLVVVGDGKYRKALERLAQTKGVADRVRFVGAQPLEECARYFNLCEVFLDPTLRTDGYDLTIAEAMSCAKPVIVSDVGANSTLIDRVSHADGILVPRGDNAALVRETLGVLGDRDWARTMGERARAKIVGQFSIPKMVQGMEAVYAEVCSQSPTARRQDVQ